MGQGGNQSPTSGYSTGNTIQKFPFSTDTNATCIGALTFSKDCAAGHSSISHGYASGGWAGSWSPPLGAALCRIERFPFATDASATCVGSFSMCILGGSGHMV
jgi:hypothetical protein